MRARSAVVMLSALAASCAASSSTSEDEDTTVDALSGPGDVTADMGREIGPDASDDVSADPAEVDVPASCGDGRVDPGEQCDRGAENSDSAPNACRADCSLPTCGDAVVDDGEQCDDGNADDADACSNSCARPAADLCTPCGDDADCGDELDACVALDDGDFCGLSCRSDRECPEGLVCGDVRSTAGAPVRQCVPSTGGCGGCFDPDRDGFGIGTCTFQGVDCAPAEADTHPDAEELCDLVDNDCDGDIDEELETTNWYPDLDRDGHGDPTGARASCRPVDGYVRSDDDCDDTAPFSFEGAAELCDGEDNDCNGDVDEDAGATAFFVDADGDGYGAPGPAESSCEPLIGFVTNDDDCDDANGLESPGRTEACDDTLDNDCDGATDCADTDCAGAPRCAVSCPDDGLEENDSADTATPVGAGPVEGAVSCPGDDDFYAVTLGVGDEVLVDLGFTHASGDVDVVLLDPSGRVVAASVSETDSESIAFEAAASGQHLVRVLLYSDAGAPGNTYAMTIEIARAAPVCRDDGFEENDTLDSSARLPAGATAGLVACPGDADTYRFDLAAGERIDLRADFAVADGDVDLRLFTLDGVRVAASLGTGPSETVAYTTSSATAVVLEVTLYLDAGDVGAPYGLEVTRVPPVVVCEDDTLEPNDAPSAAALVAAGTYDDLVLCAGDEDYFGIVVSAGDTIDAEAVFEVADGDVDLYLLDPGDRVVASSASLFGSSERVSHVAAIAGSYRVRATLATSSADARAPYAMTIALTPAPVRCADDGFEDNDTTSEATRLAPGPTRGLVACGGDPDFYQITLGAGDELRVDAEFVHSAGDIDMVLLDPSGAVVASSLTTTDDEQIAFTAGSAGTHILRVYLYGATGADRGNGYTLAVSAVTAAPVCPTDRLENNDDLSGAEPLPPELYRNLVVCSDDEDWYRFTASAGDAIEIDLSFAHADGDVDVQLLDDAGAVLAASASTSDAEGISLTASRSGAYHIRVLLYADTGAAFGNTYELQLRVTRPFGACVPDAFEDNDTAEEGQFVFDETIDALTACTDDPDFYSVPLIAGEALSVSLDFVHAEGDVDLFVLSPEGAIVGRSTGVADGESLAYTATVTGVHTIRVVLYADTGAPDGNAYALTVSVTPVIPTCPADDWLEPNDTAGSATLATDGGYVRGVIACLGDSDFYETLLLTGDTLAARALFSHADGDIDIVLYDEAGDVLDRSLGVVDDEDISYTATEPTWVTLEVELVSDSGAPGNPYSLDLAIE